MEGTNEYQAPLPRRSVPTDGRLWFGVLGGAIAWLLHLVLSYLIAEFGCVSGWGEHHWMGLSLVAWLGLAVSVSMVASAVVANGIATRNQKGFSKDVDSETSSDGERFMARSGVLANRFFIVIIIVQSIPFVFYLQGC